MMIYVIIILSVLLIVSLTRFFLLKKEIQGISKQLKMHTNRIISISSADKDLVVLTTLINQNIQAAKENEVNNYKDKKKLMEDVVNISHDLRTPLTATIGYLQLLRKTKLDEKQTGYLSAALRKADNLNLLVKNFFELSYTESGEDLNLQKINLCNFVTECIIGYSSNFEEKRITPSVNFPEKPVFIIADSELLSRIIQNILANIVKHGIEAFTATIHNSDNVYLSFENNVENTAAIDVELLFDRFYTPDKSRGNASYGLGLAIVKLLVERLNGSAAAKILDNKFTITLTFKSNSIFRVSQ